MLLSFIAYLTNRSVKELRNLSFIIAFLPIYITFRGIALSVLNMIDAYPLLKLKKMYLTS